MNKSAILHIPMSRYAFPMSENSFVVRLRTAKGDLNKCTLLYGDRAYPHTPVRFTRAVMDKAFSDEISDIYEYTINDCPSRLCYLFELEDGSEKVLYYANEFHKMMGDRTLEDGTLLEGRSEYYQYPVILRDEIPHIPEWFKNAHVYNIFPDSFADGKRHISGTAMQIKDADGLPHNSVNGGTINGIADNLDYIREMGFNCIYLNPIFSAGEYHRYDTFDYYHIDPMLGTDDDFMELTDRVHSLGMHIIIDGVFNHCSWYHPFFDDVVKNGRASRYADWFYEIECPVVRPESPNERPSYSCFAYERKMPKLNTSNDEVKSYFAGVGTYWIKKFHIDGWRLDVANEIDKDFWRKFRHAVKTADPDAVMIGEIWEDSDSWLRGDMFDSTMNYSFRNICRDFFALDISDERRFAGLITDMMLRYPSQIIRAQLNLLDSHDVARFLSLCGGDMNRWKCAMSFLYMMPGVPDVFYGDETHIQGTDESGYRDAMKWYEVKDSNKKDVMDSTCIEGDMTENGKFIRKISDIRSRYINPDDRANISYDSGRHLVCVGRTGEHDISTVYCKGKITLGDAVDYAVNCCRRRNAGENGYSILSSTNSDNGIMHDNSFVTVEIL